MKKRIYYISDLAAILGCTVASIQGHLARKNYAAVPIPIKIGRRLAWPDTVVDDWLDEKIVDAQNSIPSPESPRPRGRPRKTDRRRG